MVEEPGDGVDVVAPVGERARSAPMRAAGGTPVARLGRSVFPSTSQAASCARRSSRSWKRRTLKKLPLTQPTPFSTDPFWRGWPGVHSSGTKP